MPMSVGENPYLPPQTPPGGIPDAPRTFGWEVLGPVLLVHRTAQLPMVDPYTGGSEDPMRMHRVPIGYRPRWLWGFPALGAVGPMVMETGNWGMNRLFQTLSGMFLGWLLARIVSLFLPVCTLHLFFERRTLQLRTAFARIMGGLFVVAFLGGSLHFNLPWWVQWLPGTAFACWLTSLLACLTLTRTLRCRRKCADRFEIRGFHPKALETLARKP